MLTINGITAPGEREFFRTQIAVVNLLEKMARESVNAAMAAIKHGATIALDGSWSHIRRRL